MHILPPSLSFSLRHARTRAHHTYTHIYTHMHASSFAHARSFIKGSYWMSSVCVFLLSQNMPWIYVFLLSQNISWIYANSCQSMCCSADFWFLVLERAVLNGRSIVTVKVVVDFVVISFFVSVKRVFLQRISGVFRTGHAIFVWLTMAALTTNDL